uniref:Uncharacterized protein n=1 Tax=Morchella importuna TaxID=1174673 RepID=A0A650AG41_9PEZI|nr:hypothetical protein [Morchella importuna]QGN66728.1 hypothetical protein [Morchella importuna]
MNVEEAPPPPLSFFKKKPLSLKERGGGGGHHPSRTAFSLGRRPWEKFFLIKKERDPPIKRIITGTSFIPCMCQEYLKVWKGMVTGYFGPGYFGSCRNTKKRSLRILYGGQNKGLLCYNIGGSAAYRPQKNKYIPNGFPFLVLHAVLLFQRPPPEEGETHPSLSERDATWVIYTWACMQACMSPAYMKGRPPFGWGDTIPE